MTPGSTVIVILFTSSSIIRFIFANETTAPSKGTAPPVTPVPPPLANKGIFCANKIFNASESSSASRGTIVKNAFPVSEGVLSFSYSETSDKTSTPSD